MRIRDVIVLLAIVLFVPGCTAGALFAQSPRFLVKDNVITIDGAQRTYDLYVPPRGKDDPRPVVFLLHGHIGNADVMTGASGKKAPYKVWLSIAEREGLILVIPEGTIGPDGYRGWNDCRSDAVTNPETDDVAFIRALLDHISHAYSVDPERIYATGTSNGGHMCYRLALEMNQIFAAIAPVVASMPVNNGCTLGTRPVSVLIMNGSKDPLSPYAGGRVGKGNQAQRGVVMSTPDSVAFWRNHNNTKGRAIRTSFADINTGDSSTVERITYKQGAAGSEVVLYAVKGGGHTEPSLQERYSRVYKWIVGPQNGDIEMAEEVWAFFRDKRKPAQ